MEGARITCNHGTHLEATKRSNVKVTDEVNSPTHVSASKMKTRCAKQIVCKPQLRPELDRQPHRRKKTCSNAVNFCAVNDVDVHCWSDRASEYNRSTGNRHSLTVTASDGRGVEWVASGRQFISCWLINWFRHRQRYSSSSVDQRKSSPASVDRFSTFVIALWISPEGPLSIRNGQITTHGTAHCKSPTEMRLKYWQPYRELK